MVQGGEVFGELDTVSGRLLLQLVRGVTDILLVGYDQDNHTAS